MGKLSALVLRDVINDMGAYLDNAVIYEVSESGITVAYLLRNKMFHTIFAGDGKSYTHASIDKKDDFYFDNNLPGKFLDELVKWYF